MPITFPRSVSDLLASLQTDNDFELYESEPKLKQCPEPSTPHLSVPVKPPCGLRKQRSFTALAAEPEHSRVPTFAEPFVPINFSYPLPSPSPELSPVNVTGSLPELEMLIGEPQYDSSLDYLIDSPFIDSSLDSSPLPSLESPSSSCMSSPLIRESAWFVPNAVEDLDISGPLFSSVSTTSTTQDVVWTPLADEASSLDINPVPMNVTNVSPADISLPFDLLSNVPSATTDAITNLIPDTSAEVLSLEQCELPSTPKVIRRKKRRVVRMYCCPYEGCEKEFSRQYNLKAHEETHCSARVKPYSCDDCDKGFTRRHDLSRMYKGTVH
ncbi:hypothetical protein HDV00_002631 [Rhizophlyctis rosea]|nr:hypothetical protein HDV00_002631 [Rhizophlyctis rosea]